MNMASFAGNICFKISYQLLPRVFPIPRSIWKFQIACLKSRDFSSSVPVRYIHKTSFKVKTPESILSVKGLDYCSFANVSVSEINGGKDEIHNDLLFDDCEEGSEEMEDVGELAVHQAGDSCEQDFIRVDKYTNNVEQSAIRLLAVRALTAVELRKKLLRKKVPPNAVEAVITKFQKQGLINDRLYAESYSQSRWSSSSWGPRRIKQALFKKGVSQDDAEKAVEVTFKDNDCAEDENSVISLSKHSIDHLYTQASNQWSKGQNVPKETRKSRIIRWLQYRGFDWNVISFIVKKLEKQEQNPP